MADDPFFELLGVRINSAPFDEVLETVLNAPDAGDRLSLHFVTVHTLVEAYGSDQLRSALNHGLVEPDGMPLVWLGRRKRAERVAGPDFMPVLVERGVRYGRSHFFYGGAPGVADQVAAHLSARYPGLRVAGTLSPPFRPLSAEEDEQVTSKINEAQPDYVWVGLGTPKQDLWVADHRPRLAAAALLAVGAAFDLMAGQQRRAPEWMQRTGLEWLYRLEHEPRRLARRYTVVNARFVALVARDRLRRSLRHR